MFRKWCTTCIVKVETIEIVNKVAFKSINKESKNAILLQVFLNKKKKELLAPEKNETPNM